jgi:hypothetical protein
VAELGEEHRREVAQDAEGPGLVRHADFPGVAVDHSERNEVECLLEDDYIAAGWCCVISFGSMRQRSAETSFPVIDTEPSAFPLSRFLVTVTPLVSPLISLGSNQFVWLI